MYIRENLKMAVESIRANRMRSFLTMLGIIIGIMSVIMIISAGTGAKNTMMAQVEEIGATTITINTTGNADVTDQFTEEDIAALREIPGVAAASPLGNAYASVSYGRHENFGYVYAASQDFAAIQGVDMVSGRFFNEDEYNSERRVVVIDHLTAQNFFGTTDVAGLELTVYGSYGDKGAVGIKTRIVGVCENPNGDFSYEGMPSYLYMPFTTVNSAFADGEMTVDSVYLKTENQEVKESVTDTALNTLKARHNARDRGAYSVYDLMSEVDAMNDMIAMIQTFVAAVAAISLVVGGIGVMNIMLVSVSERTREIGIRKSLGAKTGAIMQQFLTEAAILSLIGGIIGLVLGYLGSLGICALVGVTPAFSLGTVLLTMAFSAGVGIFFGIYPARKAARLNPIEALRHE